MFLRYALMIMVLIAAGWFFFPQPEEPKLESAPEVSFTLPDGETVQLSDYRGTVTLVHFWASWCPPCLPEMPELVKLAKEYPEKLNIIALSLDTKQAAMDQYLKNNFATLPENFTALWDENGELARNVFYSFNYPETFILNCNGDLTKKILGPGKDWKKTIEPYMRECKT